MSLDVFMSTPSWDKPACCGLPTNLQLLTLAPLFAMRPMSSWDKPACCGLPAILQLLTLVPLFAIHPTDRPTTVSVTHLCCAPRHAGSALLQFLLALPAFVSLLAFLCTRRDAGAFLAWYSG